MYLRRHKIFAGGVQLLFGLRQLLCNMLVLLCLAVQDAKLDGLVGCGLANGGTLIRLRVCFLLGLKTK
jgi:hypothetical protein